MTARSEETKCRENARSILRNYFLQYYEIDAELATTLARKSERSIHNCTISCKDIPLKYYTDQKFRTKYSDLLFNVAENIIRKSLTIACKIREKDYEFFDNIGAKTPIELDEMANFEIRKVTEIRMNQSEDNNMKADRPCQNCGHQYIYITSAQTAGADEAPTIFIRCSNCQTRR